MYPTKTLWEIIKITKWKKVNYWPAKWKYNYIDIWILRTGVIEQYTNDEWIFCDEKNILIAWDGSKSWTAWFWLQWVIWSTLAKLQLTDKNILTEFVWKFLQSNFKYLNENTSWAAIPHLRKDILENLQIPLPPLPTQQKIVEKLDNILEKIEKNIELTKHNLANIEEQNKSILKKIFRECEEEFEIKKLWETCTIWPQKNQVKDFSWNVSFVPMKDLSEKQKFFEAKEIKNISEVYKWYTYFENNDVLLAKVTPCFENGKSGVAKNLENGIWFGSSEFYVFRSLWQISPEFLYYRFTCSDFLKLWKENMSGAIWLQRVSKKFIENFQIPLTPLPKQQEIVNYLDNIFEKNSNLKSLYEKNLKNLEELKQSTLKQAFEDEDFIK